jgi:hypothetical protein
MNSEKEAKNMLRVAGKHTIQFPRRERFNEDTQSVISEQMTKQKQIQKKELSERVLGGAGLREGDAMSKKTIGSKRSLSKSDLTKFFSEKKSQVAEDAKSRIS